MILTPTTVHVSLLISLDAAEERPRKEKVEMLFLTLAPKVSAALDEETREWKG